MLQPDNTAAQTPLPASASGAIPTPDLRSPLEVHFDNTPTHIRGMAALIIVSFIFMFAMQTSLMYEIKSPRLFYRGNILRGGHNIDQDYEIWPKTEEEDGDSDGQQHYKKLALHGRHNNGGVNNPVTLGRTTTTAHRVLFGEDNDDDDDSSSSNTADFRPSDLGASTSALDPSYADDQTDADQRDACCSGDTAIDDSGLDNKGYEEDSSYYNDEENNDDDNNHYQNLLHNSSRLRPNPADDHDNDHGTLSNDDYYHHYYGDYYTDDNSDWPSGLDSRNDNSQEDPLITV